MSSHTILCGNCNTPVEGPENPAPRDKISCANCGQTDSYSAVIDSAQTFVTDKAAKSLNASLAGAVKGSKHVKFTPSRVPNRQYRWTVADFDL